MQKAIKKISLITAIITLALGTAILTNLNATLTIKATSNEDQNIENENEEQAVADLVKENLQTTIEQIESDELYQKYTQLFDLVEQAEEAQADDDEEADAEVIKKIVEIAAEIGNGENEPSADRGDLSTLLSEADIEKLLATIKTIGHYQEYYELATLVQAAHQVAWSNEFSTDYVARMVESTTDAALDVEIPIKNDYTNNSSSQQTPSSLANSTSNNTSKPTGQWVQVALANQQNSPKTPDQSSSEQSAPSTSSSTKTASNLNSIVNRPSASHADATSLEELTNYNTSLADALAHTSTTCIAIGTIAIGGLSIRRQQKDEPNDK